MTWASTSGADPIDRSKPGGTPFRVSVTEADIVPHAGWLTARARILQLLNAGTPRVALLGPPGTGKSLLLRSLANQFQPASILLLDEADRLDAAALKAVPTATPCIFAGLPAFAERLTKLHPPATIVPLAPLSLYEVTRFVAARLAAAGLRRDLLTPDAIVALASHSGGAPRLINLLAGSAVLLATLDGAPCVTADHVDEAALMRNLNAGAPPVIRPSHASAPPTAIPRRYRTAVGGAIASTLVAAAWVIVQTHHPPTQLAPSAPARPRNPSPVTVAPLAHAPSVASAVAPASTMPARLTATPPASLVPGYAATLVSPLASAALAPRAPRVVIHARSESAEIDKVAALLAPNFGQAERRVVGATPHTPTIRYFFQSDAAAAHAIAATLDHAGLPWRIQRFTSYRPLPRPGTLEVWIP